MGSQGVLDKLELNQIREFEDLISNVIASQKSFLNTLRSSTKKLSEDDLLGLIGVFQFLFKDQLSL